jgi:N-carbamoyl-L-amino-acid hydrolase
VGEALDSIGYRGEAPARAFPVHACYELHIEQGPILEDEGLISGSSARQWASAGLP